MRPNITGTSVRDVMLHCNVGGSDKDYRVVVTDDGNGSFSVWTEYGPHNRLCNGAKEGTWAGSLHGAHQRANAIIHEKTTRKAYRVVGDIRPAVPPAPATNREDKKALPTKKQRPVVVAASLSSASRAVLGLVF
jgi:hypothetical protein